MFLSRPFESDPDARGMPFGIMRGCTGVYFNCKMYQYQIQTSSANEGKVYLVPITNHQYRMTWVNILLVWVVLGSIQNFHRYWKHQSQQPPFSFMAM